MTTVRVGRVVHLVREKADPAVPFSIGLEAIESGTGRLVKEPVTDYEGIGTAFKTGDLLFGKLRPYLAKAWLADRDGAAVGDFHVYRPTDRVCPAYLRWALLARNFLDPVESSVFGAKMPRADWEFIRNVEICVPSADEQCAIADYLDRETARIDTLIEEQQRLIELLRERRDGVVTKTFLNSTSEERKLKSAVDDVTVGIVVQPSRWYVDAGVPALRGVNVKRGSISLADLVNISEEGHAAHPKSQLCSGDVVVVRTGQAGAAAKIPDELDGANAIDILIVRPGEGTDSDFLVWYLNSPLAVSRIEHGSVGALQGHFNVSALRELPLPDAPLAEQQRIVAYLDEQTAKIDTLIAETERFIELARERRSALITAAVTGQIDVREMV